MSRQKFAEALKEIRELREHDEEFKNTPKFTCRLCGGHSYSSVFIKHSAHMQFGGNSHPDAYECDGCSVIFKNVFKFGDMK